MASLKLILTDYLCWLSLTYSDNQFDPKSTFEHWVLGLNLVPSLPLLQCGWNLLYRLKMQEVHQHLPHNEFLISSPSSCSFLSPLSIIAAKHKKRDKQSAD